MSELPDLTGLRRWQADALTQYLQSGQRDYTVTATPGAGKTTFALTLARHLLGDRKIDRIIIVVPTDHLRTQWGHAATRAGLLLDPTLGNDRTLGKEYDGYITTYAQVALKPTLHERRCESPHRSLVIFDEIHHAGDGLSWGEAIRHAFTPAARRLALTGTPFRTSAAEQIPFVAYEADDDGQLRSSTDFTYGYKNALADAVVRPVLFAAYSGLARWKNSMGEMLAADLLGDSLTQEQEFNAWQTVLNPAGDWVPHVIAAAADRLEEVRRSGMPDAACLVLASDQETAKAYAAVIRTVTGETPTVTLSEDPRASEKISAFSAGTDKFIVAVRMVSEGVDIPRCAVLVWLTSYRTPLFFAQAVGRVVRARAAHESATVFLPAVRPLLALAAEIEAERDHILAVKSAPAEGEWDPLTALENLEPGQSTKIEAVDATASFAHVLFAGRAVTAAPVSLDEDAEEFLGLPGLLSPEQTATLLARREAEIRAKAKKAAPIADPVALQAAQHERSGALRKEITALVNKVAARTGAPQAQVHVQARRAVPGPANPQASPDVLEARRDWLLARLH